MAKRWLWLVLGVIGGILTILSILGYTPSLPWQVGLGIFFVSLTIAQFLAFHDLRQSKDKNEWEFIRQRKIELAAQQLDGLVDTLEAMRKELRCLVDKASLKVVPQDIIDKIHTYLYREYPKKYLATDTTKEEDLKYFLDLAAVMDAFGIGLAQSLKSDVWVNLNEKLESYSKADFELNDHIKDFKITLFGSYSYTLFNKYARAKNYKAETHHEIHSKVRNLTTDFANEVYVDRALTRVSKRINQLLCGE